MSTLERRWFSALLGHAFLLQVVVMLLRIGMTYEAVSIGLDVFWIGVIGGAFGAAPAALALYTGSFIDRLGERAALFAGSAFALAASIGLWSAAPTLGSLIILSTAAGFAQFIGVAGQHSAVGKTGPDRRAGNFGHLTMVISLAHMVGPLLFGLLAGPHAVPETGPISALASLLALLLLAVVPWVSVPVSASAHQRAGVWQTARSILHTRGFLAAAVASLVLFSAMDLLVIYLPLFGAERGLGPATVGVLLSLRGAASVVSRLFFGRLYRRVERTRLVLLALVCSGVAIAAMPLAPSVPIMAVLTVVAGFGLGIGAPLTLAWITDITPSATLGSALSLRLAINRAGQAGLPVALGTVATGLGAAGTVAAIGCSLLLSGMITWTANRKR